MKNKKIAAFLVSFFSVFSFFSAFLSSSVKGWADARNFHYEIKSFKLFMEDFVDSPKKASFDRRSLDSFSVILDKFLIFLDKSRERSDKESPLYSQLSQTAETAREARLFCGRLNDIMKAGFRPGRVDFIKLENYAGELQIYANGLYLTMEK